MKLRNVWFALGLSVILSAPTLNSAQAAKTKKKAKAQTEEVKASDADLATGQKDSLCPNPGAANSTMSGMKDTDSGIGYGGEAEKKPLSGGKSTSAEQ